MTGRRLLWCLLLLTGCPRAVEPTVDAGPEVSTVDAGPSDAGPAIDAGRPAMQLEISLIQVDGGVVMAPSGARQVETEAVSAIRLTATVDLADARIRVIDWADRVVPSDDTATHDGGLSYDIAFLEPLKTGRSYQLLLDAQSGLSVTDVTGTTHDDVELLIQVRGDVVPEPGAKPKSKPKKRR